MRSPMMVSVLLSFLSNSVAVAQPTNGEVLESARLNGESITLSGEPGQRYVPSVHRVQEGDTLWDITERYYGTPWHWPRVWGYNPEVTNPHWIYPDNVIRLHRGGASADTPMAPSIMSSRRLPRGTVWVRDQGYIDRDALDRVGVITGAPEEHMLLAPHDEIYVTFEHAEDARPGDEYQIFRRMEEDERLEREEGILVRIFGTIRLRDYDEQTEVGRATIIEALDPIERGFQIAPIPRVFRWVDPVRNDREVIASVVASLRPYELPSQYQIVFVNAGSEHGVQVGNRFFIERQGDEWRRSWVRRRQELGAVYRRPPEPDVYPLEILAEGRVVHVQPRSSTLLVVRSTRVIEYGDRAEMRAGY